MSEMRCGRGIRIREIIKCKRGIEKKISTNPRRKKKGEECKSEGEKEGGWGEIVDGKKGSSIVG